MSLECLKGLQDNISKLNDIYNELSVQVTQLKATLDDGILIPKLLSETIKKQLEQVQVTQNKVLKDYISLNMGPEPSKIVAISENVAQHEKKLLEKNMYANHIRFFMHVHSTNPEAEQVLSIHKNFLRDQKWEQMEKEECDELLKKYIQLEEALLEEDQKQKFEKVHALYDLFGSDISFALSEKLITYIPLDELPEDEAFAVLEPSISQDVPTAETAADTPSDEKIQCDEENELEADENECTWEQLGISDPSAVITQIDPDQLVLCSTSSKNKSFGVKSFKRDLEKYNQAAQQLILSLAVDHNGFTPDRMTDMAEFLGKDEVFLKSACERLERSGYLDKYTLSDYGDYYTLSSVGIEIFKHASSRNIFNPPKKLPSYMLYAITPYLVLKNIVLNRTLLLVKEVFSCAISNKEATIFSEDCFIQHFYAEEDEDTSCTFVGIFSNQVESFEKLVSHFESNIQNSTILIVVGLNKLQAKNIAVWLVSFFSESLEGKTLYYLDYETGVYYDFVSDGVVQLPLLPVDNLEISEDTEHETEALSVAQTEITDCSSLLASSAEASEISTEEDALVLENVIPTPHQADEVVNNFDHQASKSEIPATLNSNYATLHKSNTQKLEKEQRTYFDQIRFEMLAQKKFYCASAYLNVLSKKYPDVYQKPYLQLAYAINDPLTRCTYNYQNIIDIYLSDDIDEEGYYLISAALRAYFFGQRAYDHELNDLQYALQYAIADNPLLHANTDLNQLLYQLKEFKTEYCGVDFYADYRQKKRECFEQTLSEIRTEAKLQYQKNVLGKNSEKTAQKRFLETRKSIFDKDGDLAVYLDMVCSKDWDRTNIELIEDFLHRIYLKDGTEVSAGNIDPIKIECIVDEHWKIAAQNISIICHTSKLTGRLRTNLCKLIEKIVKILCDYVVTINSSALDENDPGFHKYKDIRQSLIDHLQNAITLLQNQPEMDTEDLRAMAGQTVLCDTLNQLLKRLDGSYEQDNYFYLEFLQCDKVFLDENYLPILKDVDEIDELSILKRIETHYQMEKLPLETRLANILTGADDYGSATLILEYLKHHADKVQDSTLLEQNLEKAMFYPRNDMENKRQSFIEDLELAQSYGQIDNTKEDRKQLLTQIMDTWYNWAMETNNYGFFHQILKAIQNKIREDAKARAEDLHSSLAIYKNEKPNWADEALICTTINEIESRIQDQNYTAAEDLLNRLNANDLDTETDFMAKDYLRSFLDEYAMTSKQAGTAGKRLPEPVQHNKDTKGAKRLIENWPKGKGTSPEQIKNLLLALGFPIQQVKAQATVSEKEQYIVSLEQHSNYKHPVSIFGSEAVAKGFRVVNIFGKMDASRLMDTFKELGTAKNTLVLLDYTLTLPDRQELAKKTKTEWNHPTFAVIDRVVLLYLANHYSETAINRMLMSIIMPFAACQLYQPNASQDMPPELFMGRNAELEKIESPSGVNIVYGGRQLGKTALLRMAQKNINQNENGDRAVWVDIKWKDYKQAAKKISTTLYEEDILKKENITEDWEELASALKKRLKNPGNEPPIPYLLLLLDEADTFIESCASIGFQPLDVLKDIQSIGTGRFKFVVAGLHNIVRFKRDIALSNNSVLTHLSSLTVTPFKYKEARELLEVPLSYLGFRFPKDASTDRLISTIFNTTNYFPGLLQFYCSQLIETMYRTYGGYQEAQTPPYEINETLIKKVLSDESLTEQIKEKFDITVKVDQEQDNYYYLLALLAAYHYHNTESQDGCGPEDILEIGTEYGIKKIDTLTVESIGALMEEMQELNVFKRLGNGCYRFARFNFLQMMGSIQEIDDQIQEHMSEQGE